LHIIDGSVNGSAAVEDSLAVPKTPNIELPYDPTIPLLLIYLRRQNTDWWLQGLWRGGWGETANNIRIFLLCIDENVLKPIEVVIIQHS
jgi:hypothetical protein